MRGFCQDLLYIGQPVSIVDYQNGFPVYGLYNKKKEFAGISLNNVVDLDITRALSYDSQYQGGVINIASSGCVVCINKILFQNDKKANIGSFIRPTKHNTYKIQKKRNKRSIGQIRNLYGDKVEFLIL